MKIVIIFVNFVKNVSLADESWYYTYQFETKGRCKVLFESDTYASSSLSLDIKNCASQSEATIATSS